VREAERRTSQEALIRAYDDLERLRRLLAEGRAGASREWVAAAEDAIARAEASVHRAGGDPGDLSAARSRQEERADSRDHDGRARTLKG
jgi:hypothetical protein